MPDIEKATDSSHRGHFYESDATPTGSVVDDRGGKVDGYLDASSPAAQLAALSPEEYAAMEKKLVRKIDRHLIPWMTLLYLMSFLDRVNVGAAKLVGLTKELHLSSQEYSNASTVFFVTYVFFEVPSNLVLKKFRPSRWIPATMVLWAIVQTLMGLVTNYHQLLALRLVLGVFEAGLFPGLNFLLTGWYRREELNKRTAVFFAGAVLAGAFGGIFGFALSKMDGVGGKEGWSWIFIWEGILTFIIAVASFWMVHDWPEQSRFLTPLEKEMVIHRLRQEQGLAGEGKFSWRIIWKSLKDWKIYILMLMYLSAAVPLYSGSLFSPTIIASLGHWSIPQSLLLSTPPYVLCFITTLGTAYLSDKYRQRGPFLMFWSVILCVGYAILLSVKIDRPGVLYFAVFITTMAAGPLIATTISWMANTWGHHYKRAVGMGMVFSAGNSGGIVASQIYRNADAPRFIPGHATALAFGATCGLSALVFYVALKRENAKRDHKFGKPPGRDQVHDFESEEWKHKWGLEGMTRDQIVELGDDHPAFRYVL